MAEIELINKAVIGKNFVPAVVPLIDKAKYRISILVFDWRWYPNDPHSPAQVFNQAIVRASRRHIKVRALVNLAGAVEQLQALGIDCRKVTSKDLLHSKLIIIDDSIVILGSHNFTQSAFGKNFETSIITNDAGVVADLKNYFEVIFNYHGQGKR